MSIYTLIVVLFFFFIGRALAPIYSKRKDNKPLSNEVKSAEAVASAPLVTNGDPLANRNAFQVTLPGPDWSKEVIPYEAQREGAVLIQKSVVKCNRVRYSLYSYCYVDPRNAEQFVRRCLINEKTRQRRTFSEEKVQSFYGDIHQFEADFLSELMSGKSKSEAKPKSESTQPPKPTAEEVAEDSEHKKAIFQIKGELLNFGFANYAVDGKETGTVSFCVDVLAKGKKQTIWGKDLERAIQDSGVGISDQILIKKFARTTVHGTDGKKSKYNPFTVVKA